MSQDIVHLIYPHFQPFLFKEKIALDKKRIKNRKINLSKRDFAIKQRDLYNVKTQQLISEIKELEIQNSIMD